ncbi:hypothetical protein CJU90_0334 [Yarrowia sp. C11]|nr:hypothetical protein CKK34_1745 [Yarrowia sp. E02]KAG5372683.1 hypothetical protein CJU90_0334 [Yarrowia sp. C11]
MPLEESIIATRQRRANAGNRLKALLDAQEPLEDDDEHNIFMEFEDDQEFELGADEPDMIVDEEDEDEDEDAGSASSARKRRKISTEAESTDNEEDGDSDDNAETEAQGSDFFSESDSDSENDSEPEDAGEKELQKREKEEKTRKRLAARKAYEIPTMEKLAKPRVTAQAAARAKAAKEARKPVKRKSTTVEELINSDRRVSRRATAVRNTKEVLERLKEQEEKRAAYVPREKKVVKKLTQAERLAEAKITEQQNIDSLNNFFRQEDLRKQRQREAMLARRIPLKSFIRFLSSSKFVDPVPLPGVEEVEVVEVKKEEVKETPKGDTDSVKVDEAVTKDGPAVEEVTEASKNDAESTEPTTVPSAEPETEAEPKDKADTNGDVEMVDASGADVTDSAKDNKTEEPESDAAATEPPVVKKEEDSAVSATETPDVAASEEPEAKDDDSDSDGDTPAPKPTEAPKKAKMTVEGPRDKVGTTVVQLLEFAQDRNLSRPEVKRYLLGPQAVVPTGRDYSINNCVVTGKPARFRDSKSKGLYYASLEAFKVIETVREGGYNWNWGLGGVFTEHDGGKCAKNVPDGFYIKKEEPKDSEVDPKNEDEKKENGDQKDDKEDGGEAKKVDEEDGKKEGDEDKKEGTDDVVKTEESEPSTSSPAVAQPAISA